MSDRSSDYESLEEPEGAQGQASMPSNERLEPDAEGWSEQNMNSDRSQPASEVPFPPAAEGGKRPIDREGPTPAEGPSLTDGTGDNSIRAGTSRGSSSPRENSVRSSRNRSSRRARSRDVRRSEQDSGAELERRVARLEFAEGALARLRIPVRASAEPGRDVLTDIDVLSIDIDLRLRTSRSMLECKSRPGQAGEPDRLFWLAGFRSYVGAERAVLVRQTTSRRGLALARRLNLHVLDDSTLTAREAAHAWLPARFAHVGGEECEAAEERANRQLRAFGELPPELVAFLRYDALLAKSHRIFAALVALGTTSAKTSVIPDPAGLVLAGHALIALLIAALADASQLETRATTELAERLDRSLTTGSPDDDHVLNVLAQADELFRHQEDMIHRAYVQSGAPRLDVPLTSARDLVAQPPGWTERYIDLLQRLRANPNVARDLLQTAELACFDGLVGGQAHRADAFDHLFTAEHRQLLSVSIKLLQEIIGGGLAKRLNRILSLPFDRTAPALPDRRSTSIPSGEPSVSARLARRPEEPEPPAGVDGQ